MNIAITGHSAGIGKALAESYKRRGHDIVGLSQRDGNNIRSTQKIATLIEPCDVFVNNAQAGYAQTELLFEMAKRWSKTGKHIIVISSMMTLTPVSSLPGLDMIQYKVQKTALEDAVKQIRNERIIRMTVVRPGNIATSPDKTVPPSADPNVWAERLLQIFDIASPELIIPDISLGPVI